MFNQACKDAGLDIEKDAVMLDIRDMTNEQAFRKVEEALEKLDEEEES
jgi:hypothetical protein